MNVKKRTAELDQPDELTTIAGTMILLLTIRHSSHEWSQGRSQEETFTDINPSGIKATLRQATGEQEMEHETNSCTIYPTIPYSNR